MALCEVSGSHQVVRVWKRAETDGDNRWIEAVLKVRKVATHKAGVLSGQTICFLVCPRVYEHL
jgi:hypothetical protein